MDTPTDPAQTKGRRMSPTRARLATLEAQAQRILTARTLAETIVFSLENGWVSFKIRSFPREN